MIYKILHSAFISHSLSNKFMPPRILVKCAHVAHLMGLYLNCAHGRGHICHFTCNNL